VPTVPLGAGFAIQGGDPSFDPIAAGASAIKPFEFTPLARSTNSFIDAIVTSNATQNMGEH